jgi:sulfatase modifying factor 1
MKPVAIAVGMLVAAIFLAGCSFWEDLPAEEEQETDTTVTLEHSGGMVLVKAKDSSFEMGSISNQPSDLSTNPIHTVKFTYDFWMDTTEVTHGKFDSVMKIAYPDYITGSWNMQYGKGDHYPVHGRNWYDAVLYCNGLSTIERLDTIYKYSSIADTLGNGCELAINAIAMQANGYRLPTEAEWEYACRAGTKDEFYWGNSTPGDYAWYITNTAETGTAQSVAQKNPNAFGIYDMSGNALEWCNDWNTLYSDSLAIDPIGGSYGTKRILRGGSWENDANSISSSSRYVLYPFTRAASTGFRVVKRKF